MVIDLHGLTEQEAVARISTALFALEHEDGWESATFITGKGPVLRLALEDFLDRGGYRYHIEGRNAGAYVVYPRRN